MSTKSIRFTLATMAIIGCFVAPATRADALEEAQTSEYGTNRAPIQVFYTPLPEEHVYDALRSIWGNYKTGNSMFGAPSSPLESYVSIAIFLDNTVIYYDQWEDGYERDIANPNHLYSAAEPFGTQIWGDGDPSNGCVPGISTDKLGPGDIIELHSTVALDRIGQAAFFDGCDKFGSTKPIAATRTLWASESKTLFAGANEMYDTTYFGDEFVCPVGENIASTDQYEIFEYVGLSIMAGPGGATIQIDKDNNGAPDTLSNGATSIKLVEGEPYLVDGGVKLGGRVVATEGTVQVELVTGDVFDGYESRFMKLLPRRLWANAYTCPVAAPLNANNTTCGSKIWIYNPGSTRLSVTCKSTAKTQTVTVAPGSYKFVIPAAKPSTTSFGKSGSSLSADLIYTGELSGTYLTADAPFYALCTVDCIGTTASTTKSAGLNRTWDWGFSLIPDSSLSSQVVVGLGLGRDPTSTVNPNENAAPVWVTAPVIANDKLSTTLYYQLPGETTARTKTLSALQSLTLYGDRNQTGMRVWTTDGTKLAAAWGSDPAKATAGQPGLDMGTGIPPMPEIFMQKSSRLANDPDGDSFTAGDTIEYTVEVMNVGHVRINGIVLKDILPEGVTYVNGSFAVKTVEGSRESNVFAIDDRYFADVVADGLDVTQIWDNKYTVLEPDQSWVYTYSVTIDASARGVALSNMAILNSGVTSLTNSVTDYLRASVGDRVWLDADGDGIQYDGEIGLPYATVSLVNAETGYLITDDFDRPYSMVTDDSGAYLFRGVRPGNYRVVVSVPAAYEPTVSGAVSNRSETDSDIGQTAADGFYSTEVFVLEGGDARRDIDAGFIVRDDAAAISLVKTAGDAADGETLEVERGTAVTYTFQFTNTGDTYLKDVTVTDDKMPGWSFVFDGVLAPGETAVATAPATIRANVTNTGTVVGTPTDALGHDLPGIEGNVTDSDDAVVTVPDMPAMIGDRVWADLDGDGVQDNGEPGLAGVTVTLKDSDGNVVASTTTDANGNYLFEDVPAGSYTVVFTSPDNVYEFTTKDAGSDDAADSDADASGVAAVTVAEGEVNLSIDAGLKVKSGAASVAIVKTAGDAADGTDLQLARYGDTAVYIYKITNTGLAYLSNVVVTDDKLPGWSATVEGVLAPGASVTLTASAALTNDTTNVGTVTATPTTKSGDPIFDVPSVTARDSAVVRVPLQTATIGDRVWIDADGNGIQDASEIGLSGVTVTLKDSNSTVVATTSTDGNGNYLFTDVVPGTYTVVFQAPADWTFTAKDAGSDDAADSDADSTGVAAVTVAPGANDRTIDAGLVLANGVAAIQIVKTAGDAADGVTLRTASIGEEVIYTYKVTNIGRTYLKDITVTDDKLDTIGTIALLAPGASQTLTKTAAISEDTENIGTATGTPCNENGDTMGANVTANDNAFVDVPDEPASIGDRAWVDLNGNGVQDAGEPGLPGVTVTLKDDTGAVVATTVTDANGTYLFGNVAPGDYTVTFAPAEAWWNSTTKDAGGNDAADSDINAAGVTGSFTLVSLVDDLTRDAGFVFDDSAASIAIAKTASETAIGKSESVTYAYKVTNTGSTYLTDVAVTDDKLGPIGTIALLAPGASQTLTATAVLTEDTINVGTATGTPADSDGDPIPGASDVSANDTASVTVNSDPAVIGDRVWNDVDGDGIQDDGEMGVYNVTVNLLLEDGTVVATTKTDANGNYLFTDVEPGTYIVEFVPSANYTWSFTAKDAGDDENDSDADPETGRTAPFTVAAGETNLALDAGLVGGVPSGICDWTEISSKFNAFIGGNFISTGGDSEGNLFVAGNASLAYGFSVGLIGPGYGRTRNSAPLGTDALVVVGNLREESQPDINGNIVYGGTYTNVINSNFDARPYELRHVPVVTFDSAWNVPADASGKSVASVKAGLDAFSAVVAALEERGDPQYIGPFPELYDPNITWTATDDSRSVFVITNDTFTLVSAALTIAVPEGKKAVVNFLARDVRISWSSITLVGTDPTKVLYNFPNATNIVVEGCNFEGSVFAPKANVRLNGAAVNGFAYFGGDALLEVGAEFHDFAFKAFDCSPYFAMRPTLSLSVTAGDAANGAVLATVDGESVVLTEVVENTGDYTLSDVTLVDVLGRRLSVGDLPAGTSATYQVVVTAAAATTTYRATASGTSLDAAAAPYLGTTITAEGSASIEVFATAEARQVELEARLAANVRATGAYQPRPDLEVLSIEFVDGAPTLTNETFSVRVVVANSGEIATRTGRLSAYVVASDPVAPGTPADSSVDLRGTAFETLLPGESFEYVFTGLRTPDEGGACHVRVLADADGVVEELSEGNNQLPAFAWLTPITLATAIDDDGVLLSWNCYEGQTYTILVSPLLSESRLPFTGEVEILDADGDVTEVTDGLAVPADPSGVLAVRIPTTEADVSGFFSLRVNILNDDSDVR